jgi:hypothetical protein
MTAYYSALFKGGFIMEWLQQNWLLVLGVLLFLKGIGSLSGVNANLQIIGQQAADLNQRAKNIEAHLEKLIEQVETIATDGSDTWRQLTLLHGEIVDVNAHLLRMEMGREPGDTR